MNDKPKNTVLCNVLFVGMGNIPIGFIAADFAEVLQRLHQEDENDRYCDGYTETGQPFRVYRNGIGGIGLKDTGSIAQVKPTILRPS